MVTMKVTMKSDVNDEVTITLPPLEEKAMEEFSAESLDALARFHANSRGLPLIKYTLEVIPNEC